VVDETASRPGQAADGGGLPGGSPGEQSPLQGRAEFFPNGSWDLVVSLNRGACARGGAQHGISPEAAPALEAEWRQKAGVEWPLGETIDFLRSCHRRAPFLFFNGNTFADFGRRITAALLAEVPASRLRQITSAVAHYIAGVLDREPMVEIVETLCRVTDLRVGQRVKTLAGSVHGTITRVLDDGRVAVRPDGTTSELLSLPESLLPED
jgi:hypothetical protein